MRTKALFTAIILAPLFVCAPLAAQEPEAALPAFLTAPAEESGRKCALFVFGHFDDDSVISGTIYTLLRAGWDVHVAWLTSAGMGGPVFGTVEQRTDEMKYVYDTMGLPPENRHVLGIPDRECIDHLAEAADKVTGLVKKYRPSVVVTDAYEGGHWDHDATCLAAYVASRRVDFDFARFEIATYNASGPKIMPFRVNGYIKAYGPSEYVPLDRAAWKMRKKVRYGYKSQWFFMWPEGIIFWHRHWFGRGRGEPLRQTPDYDFLEPPHPGKMLLQRKVGVMPGAEFSQWEQEVRKLPEFSGLP